MSNENLGLICEYSITFIEYLNVNCCKMNNNLKISSHGDISYITNTKLFKASNSYLLAQ